MIVMKPIDRTDYTPKIAWCGPSAVSILTGISLVRATELMTRIHGSTYDELQGVWPEDVILALRELGYTVEPVDIVGRYPELTHGPTLERFLRERHAGEYMSPLLVEVDGHLLTAHMAWACDNWVNKPVPIERFPKRGRLVKGAWQVRR